MSMGGAGCKHGFLVVNGFLGSAKFDDLYRLLQAAFARRGAELEIRSSSEFATPLGSLESLGSLAPDTPKAPKAPNFPDFVLFWDKDAALARRFEDAGLKVYNSSAAVAACDDKILTALALSRAGLPTPATIVAPLTFEGIGYVHGGMKTGRQNEGVGNDGALPEFLRKAGERLGFPMVIKEAYGSFGAQVYLAETLQEAAKIVSTFGHKRFLMQEYIPAFPSSRRGRDLRVNVVAGKVVATILRENLRDFRSNVTNGGTAKAIEAPNEVVTLAVAAAEAVGADFAGVDVLLRENGEPLVCEVNSNPSFRSTLDATGINLADFIVDLVCSKS